MMPVVILTPIKWSRSPLQNYFLMLLAVSGILIAAGISRNQLTREIGEPYATIWGASIFTGAAIAIIGSYWKDQVDGMLIERFGIFILGTAALFWFSCIIIFQRTINSMFSAIVVLIFAAMCYRQVRYINNHISLIIEALKNSEAGGPKGEDG